MFTGVGFIDVVLTSDWIDLLVNSGKAYTHGLLFQLQASLDLGLERSRVMLVVEIQKLILLVFEIAVECV